MNDGEITAQRKRDVREQNIRFQPVVLVLHDQTPNRLECLCGALATFANIELNEDGKFRINPLATWSKEMVQAEFKKRGLPEHPLVSQGYLSIGCAPCTRPIKAGEDERAGRWAHTAELPGGEKKVECGIHLEGMPTRPDWNI